MKTVFFDRRIAADALAVSLAFVASFEIALGLSVTTVCAQPILLIALGTLLKLACLYVHGNYRVQWRHVSASDTMRLTLCLSAGSVTELLLWNFLWMSSPFSAFELGRVFIVDASLSLLTAYAIRLTWRLVHERKLEQAARQKGRRTLIFGAGVNGRMLAKRFTTESQAGIWLVGFVDDDEKLVGSTLCGAKVLGKADELEKLLKGFEIQDLVIAATNLSGPVLQKVLQTAHSCKVRPKMLARFDLDINDSAKVELFRDAELDDLLKRPRISVDLGSIDSLLEGKVVLVTGGGGSIGSELVRQIITRRVSKLLVLDHSEYNLYKIDQEIKAANHGSIIPVLADLKDADPLFALVKEHKPDIIFHAAAYKHVHLVEANPQAAILNNVLGMRNMLEASEKSGCGNFVLISTDKAVNPVGIMGATKRACELMLSESARRTGKRYCAVRFGNVLGSSGSFIPLLKQQIRNGGPVTITHQDMTRYFMLIPEAVSLVLKASSISNPGDINILRMGDPIRIVDIAKNLITLVGKKEDEVPIVYTGMRPGEKMFEELYLCGNEVKTEHPDIVVLPNGDAATRSANAVDREIDRMIEEARTGKPEAVKILMELVRSNSLRLQAEKKVA